MAGTEREPADGLYVGPLDNRNYYELGPLIDEGGQGRLHVAWVATDGGQIRVAIKRMHDFLAEDLEARLAEWRTQMEALRSIERTPGIVTVRDVFVGEPPHASSDAVSPTRDLYVVMNFLEGASLRTWLDDHLASNVRDRLGILVQPASALDVLAAGIGDPPRAFVHGDVTPNNIIDGGERLGPVLVDFGISRFQGSAEGAFARMGTPGYRAPEVERRAEWQPAADRFALAGCAYFLLTGEDPPGDNNIKRMRQRLTRKADVATYADLTDRLLAWRANDPADRTGASCSAWLASLRGATTNPAPAPMPPPDPRPPIPPHRRRTLTALVVLLAIAVAGIAGALISQARNDETGGRASPGVDESDGQGVSSTRSATNTVQATTTSSPSTSSPTTASTTPLTVPPTRAPPQYRSLTELDIQTDGGGTDTVQINGTEYRNSLVSYLPYCSWDMRDSWEFNLSRDFARLRTVAGIQDISSSDSTMDFRILVDGNEVFIARGALGESFPIDLDISGALRIRFEIIATRDLCGTSSLHDNGAFGDPQVMRAD